jgi:hypothetical protein
MRKSTLLIIVALFISHSLYAQVKMFTGRVVDEKGYPLAGVSVFMKGSRTGTSTDTAGKYRINIPVTAVPCMLMISYVGFEPKQIRIGKKELESKDFTTTIAQSSHSLDEVVVVGYSTAKKSYVTGSVAGVSSDKAFYTTTPAHSKPLAEALDGKVAGLSITSGSSTPAKEAFYEEVSKGEAKSDVKIEKRAAGQSKVLTAGEVNDFSKWKLWEGYSEKEFKSHSESWGMKPAQRYSVQVVNHNKTAMVNYPVYLINRATKDTIWRAFTDNTGKAELWNRFFTGKESSEDVVIADGRSNTLDRPSSFDKGMNVLKTDRLCTLTNEVDIAFVVDATGSMGDEINYLKAELEDVIQGTMDKQDGLSLRTGSVFYRDTKDAYLTRHIDFSNDLSATVNFVKEQTAGGGGDTPEALDEAIAVALDSLQWNARARTRLLFLVLDAPPHDDAKERMRKLISRAASMGVRIIPIACSGTDKSTEFLLRSMALATNGTYAFLTDHSGVGNPHMEATTDKYDVELLNNLMKRLIGQFIYATECDAAPVKAVDTRQADNILEVKVYPNPTSGQFTIAAKKDIREIYITDFTGKILMRISDTPKKKQWRVDIGKYPSGVYFVKYVTTDEKWGAQKIVLMR